MAERKKRLDAAGIAQAVALFTQLPVRVDPETNEHASAETLSLARQHTLSVYDAAYLELALRRGATLASLDGPQAPQRPRRRFSLTKNRQSVHPLIYRMKFLSNSSRKLPEMMGKGLS